MDLIETDGHHNDDNLIIVMMDLNRVERLFLKGEEKKKKQREKKKNDDDSHVNTDAKRYCFALHHPTHALARMQMQNDTHPSSPFRLSTYARQCKAKVSLQEHP